MALLETWPGGSLRITALTGERAHLETAAFGNGGRLADDVIALAPDAVAAHPAPAPTLATTRAEYRRTGGAAVAAVVALWPWLFAPILLLAAVSGVGPDQERVPFLIGGLLMALAAYFASRRAWRLAQVRSALTHRFAQPGG